ncbi:hydantoinase/oxoprolinase family protein [Roseiarcaceae bacterium H3SJ34-1]|uniref:hydantoinase/oxoprolinase family protein n=1 Tax=Terripilifer ovatus TaxID=3032367 RepID=UPI003AB989E3|nr:hydantoinase/oxoprolinase family protein [Roseiarcaceae bacterium H3SJ34-1]
MALIVGTDIGGTFTDVVGYDTEKRSLHFGKGLTDYGDLVNGVFDCLSQIEIDPAAVSVLKHGTTQVINILLERKGARTALVTTKGFRDVLEIGRASRPLPFDLTYRRDPPLVERALRFEVNERIDAKGQVLQPLDMEDLERICRRLEDERVEAVAVSFLNAYVTPSHEDGAAAFIRARLPHVYVTTGAEHSREWFEFERSSTAAANAYVGPRASHYVQRLETRLDEAGFDGRLLIMGSHGGVLSVRRAREQPVALVESGPIGGCIGATAYADALGLDRMVAFDMGGTTAKCALIEKGSFEIQPTYYIGGYEHGLPLRTPVLDIVEVGTGGGSIAYVDRQEHLHVGPRSAGSNPGPVCFRRGGNEPTVTDANVVLGRIGSGAFLSGSLSLDRDAAVAALMGKVGTPLGFAAAAEDQVARGVLALANAQMGTAIKEVTVERGKDIRDFTLFVFGGGGPLHGVELARELGIRRVVVPPEPGNFSALGMLFAPARIDEIRTVRLDVTGGADDEAQGLAGPLADMEAHASAALLRDFEAEAVAFERQAEMRYKGQRHTIRVAVDARDSFDRLRQAFLTTYAHRYGRADADAPVELIGLRVTAIAAAPAPDLRAMHRAARPGGTIVRRWRDVCFNTGRLRTLVLNRYDLPPGFQEQGPAIIEEFGATTLIGPGDRFEVGQFGELQITISTAAGLPS